MFPQPIPAMLLDRDVSLYLLLDGSQISGLEKKLYSLLGNPELEPIYLYPPWDQLREVTPYLVKASDTLIDWYLKNCASNEGYFIASKEKGEIIAESLRKRIQVKSPYGSDVFFKMAHSEASWIFFEDEHPLFWQHIQAVWIPTRSGWKHKKSPQKSILEGMSRVEVTDEQWKRLGEISWHNTVGNIRKYLAKWFPAQIPQPSDEWLNQHATQAYNKGFSSERDLLLYFSILGFLGEDALHQNRYPDIQALVNKPSLDTPSQRIEKAADLAEYYAAKNTTRE